MAALLQIVDGIDGPVLVDLNTAGQGAGGVLLGDRGEVNLTSVDVTKRGDDQPVVWSAAAGPEGLGTRTVTLPLVVHAAHPSQTADLVATVNRLTRRPWWLRVRRHGSDRIVHLRCWPTAPKWASPVTGPQVTIARGTVEARTDPYGYGPRVDAAFVDVVQDPSVPGAWTADIDNVQGDSPTPLCLSSDDPALLTEDHGLLIAVRRRGIPSLVRPVVAQAETAALLPVGTNPPTMTVISGDPDMSGGAGVSVVFADAGGTSSLGQLTIPGATYLTDPIEATGTYRLLVRARRVGDSAGLEHNVRATVGPYVADALFTAGGADTRVLDLGLVQVPAGQPPYHAAPHISAGSVCPDVTLLVWRTSAGTGRLDVDWVALIPADEGHGIATGRAGGVPSGRWWHLDGYDHTPRVFTGWPYGPGAYAAGQSPSSGLRFVGGVPQLSPGSNRLWVLGGLHLGSQGTWPPSKVIRVQVSYWPRYGWLA